MASIMTSAVMGGLTVVGTALMMTSTQLQRRWREWRAFYAYVYEVHRQDHVATILHILQSACSVARIYITQYVFHNSTRKGKNLYEIEYSIHCQRYRMLVRFRPGPRRIRKFTLRHDDDHEEDVTDTVMPYFGPNQDFHGTVYTPRDFGFETAITMHLMNGTPCTFQVDEPIVLPS